MSADDYQRAYFDSISPFSGQGMSGLYRAPLARRVGAIESFDVAGPYFEAVPDQDRINQALFLDMQLLLGGNNLVKPDRMGMAVSLEARTPFLEYRVMEFALRMPGELKLRNGITKYLYKKAVTPLIGETLAQRRKQMFTVPVGDWFRTTKSGYCEQRIAQLAAATSLLNEAAMRTLLDEHRSMRRNNTRELRALISLSHWFDRP